MKEKEKQSTANYEFATIFDMPDSLAKYNMIKKVFEKECKYCGEKFNIYPCLSKDWCYKIGTKYFCSWNHQIAYEKYGGIKEI